MATAVENNPTRRQIRFASHQEIVDEVRGLIATGYETRGKWTLAQILEHLARGIDATYDGFDFTVPWFARLVVGPWMKKKFLHEAMPAGYKFQTKTVLEPPADVQVDQAFEHLVSCLERMQTEAPKHPHPLLGKLTHEQWKLLGLRHAELHLSFVHTTS